MQIKERSTTRPSRPAAPSGRGRPRRAEPADSAEPADPPERYRRQQLAIWAVAEANRRRCAHRSELYVPSRAAPPS